MNVTICSLRQKGRCEPSARNGGERQAGAVVSSCRDEKSLGVRTLFSLNGREIDFDLVEPTGVDRCMNED
jgi:hypothetical protein